MAEDPYRVHLPVFEGPLDLLLHLIRKNEVDIQDVRLEEVTQQYLDYLDLMKRLDLDIAGEFLVMASTLLLIKSRSLLPRDVDGLSDAELGEEDDPRLDLIRQLMEYRQFRDAAERLGGLQSDRAQTVVRSADDLGAIEGAWQPRPLNQITLFDLMEAFRRVLDTAESRDTSREIGLPRYTIRDRIDHILHRLSHGPRMAFHELFQGTATREEMVVSFLARLELIRLQKVAYVQDRAFGEIWIEPRVPDANDARQAEIEQDGDELDG